MPNQTIGSDAEKRELEENLTKALTQCCHQYTKGFSITHAVPAEITRDWHTQLQQYDKSMAQQISNEMATALSQARTLEESNQSIIQEVQYQQKRLSNIRKYSEEHYRVWTQLLRHPDYPHYLYISERSETTCERCYENHGKVFGAQDLQFILPPLHPHCACILVALDSQMVVQYQYHQDAFIHVLSQVSDELTRGAGGVFYLDHSAASDGINEHTLIFLSHQVPLQILHSKDPVTVMAEDFDLFLQDSKEWLIEFLGDAGAMVTGIGSNAKNQFEAGVALWDENPLLALGYMADALTLTITSGTWAGIEARYEEMVDDPSLYTISNFFTLGMVEMFEDTLFPDEAWSFEHWMNIVGSLTLVYGAVKFGIKAAVGVDDVGRNSIDDMIAGTADDIVRPIVGDDLLHMTTREVDDILQDVASKHGDIISTESANIKNAAILKRNPSYEPSYIPDTTTYQIILNQDTKFVRVYGGGSGQMSGWVVRADDIAGLTPNQIKSKLSLPQPPEYICDVLVPAGTKLEVSGANGILGGTGGGVQFSIQGGMDETWFTNSKLIN